MKEYTKGTYGYLDHNKISAWKKAVLLLSLPITFFAIAWAVSGTRMTVATVIAVCGCLPGCNQVVRAIMASRYHSIDKQLYDETEAARGERKAVYECVFTTYEENYYVDCLILSGRELAGYSSDSKTDEKHAAEYLRKMLKDNSYKQNVKIFKEKKAFLERVRALAEGTPEEVPFKEDERYPGLGRDEIICGLLQTVSL